MTVEIVKKDLPDFKGDAWLVKKDDKFFVVSGAHAPRMRWEVLVFPANEQGEVTSWWDVCGGISHDEAIQQLDELSEEALKRW